MYRRRLAAFAGAIGLLGALFSSGVAARADTLPGVDTTLSSLMSTYIGSSQDACVGGTSTSIAGTTTCTIDETSSNDKNIAVCVQSNTPGSVQECKITQTNLNGNNYALIFQHVVDNSGPTEDSTQSATISQSMITAGTGSNFAAIVQVVKQSTKQAGDQSQTIHQFNTTDQASNTGTNLAILNESSDQSGQSVSSMQTQFSEQDVNTAPHHINQSSTGLSRAFATQSQVQNLTGTGVQTQTIDPRCCSEQNTNPDDVFTITQFVSQTGSSTAAQQATSFGECHSSGTCAVSETTTENGVTTNNSCPAPEGSPTGNCTAFISCTGSVCTTCSGVECFPPCNCLGLLLNNANFGNLALASPRGETLVSRAPVTFHSASPPGVRSADNAALLT